MSNIEWTGKTWNPSVGCHKVSQGCKNCYAEKMHARLTAMGVEKYAEPFRVVKPWPAHLDIPLRRKKPTTWFVNSMTDSFHADLSDEYIAAVFGVLAACPQHTFQILTKRAKRLPRWFKWLDEDACDDWKGRIMGPTGMRRHKVCIGHAVREGIPTHKMATAMHARGHWPLPNVWLGVSVEDQDTADERIPLLLQCPAAVRFVSYEPALGPVDFAPFIPGSCPSCDRDIAYVCTCPPSFIDWLIVGGESGPGARPFCTDWARNVVRQCQAAEVVCFVKQMGSNSGVYAHCDDATVFHPFPKGMITGKGGDLSEWPEDLRVREVPT